MRARHYTYNYDTPFFKVIQKKNCELLKIFFTNNSYLLKKKGISLYRQIKDLNAEGIKLDYGNIHKLKSGKDFSVSLSYLYFFCVYWGLSLADMISCNLEERDKMLAESR